MLTKLFIVPVVAALLLTGTAYAVSLDSGQSAQLPEAKPAVSTPVLTQRASENTATHPPVETTVPAQADWLTRQQAAGLALKHAGFTADQVQRLHTELERDERIPHYDVEVRVDRWEYSYEIHAETGKILEYDKDWDD